MGFTEQAFKRACVRESLQHGEENVPYGQRIDYQRIAVSRRIAKYVPTNTPVAVKPSVFEAATVYEASRKKEAVAGGKDAWTGTEVRVGCVLNISMRRWCVMWLLWLQCVLLVLYSGLWLALYCGGAMVAGGTTWECCRVSQTVYRIQVRAPQK